MVEVAPTVGDEAAASADVALDVGQNLSTSVIEAQRTRRAVEPFTLQVPQQVVDG